MDRSYTSRGLFTLLPVAIAINISIGLLVHVLKLPVYLDSIGTVLVGYLVGPFWAAVVGAASMVIGGILMNPYMPYYAGTAAVVGLIAGVFGRLGWYRSMTRVIILGIVLAVVAAVVSAPVTVLLFGGITGAGSTAIVAVLRASGRSLVKSVLITGFIVEILDKVITTVIAALLIRAMPPRLLDRFPLTRISATLS